MRAPRPRSPAPAPGALHPLGAALALLALAASCRQAPPDPPPAASPPLASAARPEAPPEPPPEAKAPEAKAEPPPEPAAGGGCVEQTAQEFLIRHSYVPIGSHSQEHTRALTYRAEHYGAPPGRALKGLPPAGDNAVDTSFFGVKVSLNRKIVPVLRCVEEKISAECGTGYKPGSLSGIRYKNTFRGGEVSNHLFGIALDVDAMLNPCCGCVEPFRSNPRCKRKVKAPEERMAMPYCWVKVFERYGFYWLGHDALGDTMHFEFLGDPDRAAGPQKAALGITPPSAAEGASP